MNWPYIMTAQGQNLFRYDDRYGEMTIKVAPFSEGYLPLSYPQHPPMTLFLDEISINASSAEDYFDSVARCVSPGGYPGIKTPQDFRSMFASKRNLFAHFRNQAENGGFAAPGYCSHGGIDYEYTLQDILIAFNTKSLALLSLPAYFTMDFGGKFMPVAPNDPEHDHVWCPIYNFDIPTPGGKIYNFDDYFQAFIDGTFLRGNNSDMFLTLYGLARGICLMVNTIDWSGLSRFSDIVAYEPLARLLTSMVEEGAKHSPFSGEPTWRVNPEGILNANEICPDLAGALRLAKMLDPITHPFISDEFVQVFYFLIGHFNLREYFNIPYTSFAYVDDSKEW